SLIYIYLTNRELNYTPKENFKEYSNLYETFYYLKEKKLKEKENKLAKLKYPLKCFKELFWDDIICGRF
ncbi:MAG: hypothetical protein J7K36_02860, partial [Archaeoglobaceae archaeon]|nr:hypothetical protein [Archaeoglobaceae archaeon]